MFPQDINSKLDPEIGFVMDWPRVLSHLLSWLTPGQVNEKSREDPEIGFVMGWPTTHPPTTTQLFLS